MNPFHTVEEIVIRVCKHWSQNISTKWHLKEHGYFHFNEEASYKIPNTHASWTLICMETKIKRMEHGVICKYYHTHKLFGICAEGR